MRWSSVGIFFFSFTIISHHPSLACTIFKVTQGKTVFVGNNEDDNNPNTKVWVLAPEEGKFGRIYFGYNDGGAQGGMNDQGLFFDWVADNWSEDWKRDPNKLNYPGSVSEKILEEARSVEEALKYYEKYNETALQKSRTMLVDKTGASAIVSWKGGKVQIVRRQGSYQTMGYGNDTAQARFKSLKKVTREPVQSILEACIQNGEYPTQYSNLYDLPHGEVYVYLFHQKKPFIKLNLQKELKKGHHFYNIPMLAQQLKQPIKTDNKTQKIAQVDPASYTRLTGRYLIQPDYVMAIEIDQKKLYVQAPDVSRIEILPASSTRFFFRSLDSHLDFKPEPDGQVNEMVLYVLDRVSVAKRIK